MTRLAPEKRWQLRGVVLWTVVITIGHFAAGTRTHALHGLHILLGSLYLVPILLGAMAFEVRGGVMTALVVSGVYLLHMVISWMGQPLENADQYAMVGVYVFFGAAGGLLVRNANRRRWERDEVIRRSRRSETISGLMGLLTAVGARDPETLRHSERVARLCEIIATRMGLDSERVSELRLAGLVHDVGKVSLHDDVLFSNTLLAAQQRAELNGHAETAAHMVRSIHGAERIAEAVGAHHECPDGSGYPRGLRGDQISLDAHILRVADVFAALSEERRYKGSMQPTDVLEIMRPMVGTKLGGEAFAALEAALRDGAWSEGGRDLAAPGSTASRGDGRA